MEIKSFYIAKIINEVYEGVERSVVGSIYNKDSDGNIIRDSEGYPRLNNIPYQTYLSVLNSVFPKNMIAYMNVIGNFEEGENKVKIEANINK